MKIGGNRPGGKKALLSQKRPLHELSGREVKIEENGGPRASQPRGGFNKRVPETRLRKAWHHECGRLKKQGSFWLRE